MKRTITKQELKIRKQMAEIREYNANAVNWIDPEAYFSGERYKEALSRIKSENEVLGGVTIDEVIEDDTLRGNYPMTKERLLELVELIPENVEAINDANGMRLPYRDYVKYIDINSLTTASQLYAYYLKNIKSYVLQSEL